MTPKEQLIAQAQAAGLTLTGKETVKDLTALIAGAAGPGSSGQAAETPAASEEAPASVPAPSLPTVASAPVAVGSKAERMKAWLDTQPKVSVFIPLANGEKAGVTQSVILNGYHLFIRKGQQVVVPQPVADILEEKLKQRMAVDNHPLRADAEGGVKLDRFGS